MSMVGKRVKHSPQGLRESLGFGTILDEGHYEGSTVFYNVKFDSGETHSMCSNDLEYADENDEKEFEDYFVSTKSYYNYPCAHRQYRHDGNCALIHGYSRSFHFVFGVKSFTKEGFVVDYGDLDELKAHLDYMYDHTLVLDEDDPHMDTFRELEKAGVCHIRTHPMGPGMEGTAHYLCEWADDYIREKSGGRAWVISVEARENDKNSSIYYNPNAGFKGWLK